MLEALDQIDWKSMDAEVVTEVLRSYIQGYKVDYQTYVSYEKLFFLNSPAEPMIYEQEFQNFFADRKVIAVLVPFLIQILQLPEVNSDIKTTILWDLSFIASYFLDYLEGRNSLARYPEYVEYATKLRKMVWESHDTYFTFLDSEDDSAKTAVLDLLSRFHEYADIVLPHLRQRLQVETDRWKEEIMRNLSQKLLRSNSAKASAQRIIQEQVMTFLREDQPHSVRVATFLVLIDMLGSKTPSHVIDVMLDYYINQVSILKDLPTDYVGPGRTLMQLGVDKGISVAIKIMEQSPSMDAKFNAVYVSLLLAFDPDFPPNHFGMYYPFLESWSKLPPYTLEPPNGHYSVSTNRGSLTPLQKRILKLLVGHDWIWDYRTNFHERFGLPDQREELRQWL